MNDSQLRQDVIEMLRGGHAHVSWDQALERVGREERSRPPRRGMHTVWQLLEHARLAQEDILRYTLEPGWVSPAWPEGYWPSIEEPTDDQWRASVGAFRRDLDAVIAFVRNPAIDLTAVIPHCQAGHTYLREALLVADHNAYHCGQVVLARRLLGRWKERG